MIATCLAVIILSPEVQWMKTHFRISLVSKRINYIDMFTAAENWVRCVEGGGLCSCRQDGGNRLSKKSVSHSKAAELEEWTSNDLYKGVKWQLTFPAND